MDEERRTSANLKACHPCRPRAGVLHQHRLPRSHRRRDPHLDARRPGAAQGRRQGRGLDPVLRGPERADRPRRRLLRPGADRQGHVGPARRHGGDAGSPRSATRMPAPTPPGCRPPPRRPCMRCTITRSTCSRRRSAATTSPPPASRALFSMPVLDPSTLTRGRDRPRARQQRPGHPRLRGALGRPGRRLLQGARHQRCRPDGGPRHLPHLLAGHRQLAASTASSPRPRSARPSSGWPRWWTSRTPAIRSTSRMAGHFDTSIAFQAALDAGARRRRPALGLYRADPPCSAGTREGRYASALSLGAFGSSFHDLLCRQPRFAPLRSSSRPLQQASPHNKDDWRRQ